MQYHARARAVPESISRSLRHLPLLLRAQSAALQVLVRVRCVTGWLGDARRVDRSADADSDGQDSAVSRGTDGRVVLEALHRSPEGDGGIWNGVGDRS